VDLLTRSSFHTPVLPDVVAGLAAGSQRAVDATAGGGGHAELLRQSGARVLALDRDPQAVSAARARLEGQGVSVGLGNFAESQTLEVIRAFGPDLVLLDLGVSSYQLDQNDRGFSFRRGVPLDMRMSPDSGAPTAGDLLNRLPESALARIFHEYGDEPRARRLARSIVARRAQRPFRVSDDLVGAIRGALGPRTGPADFARLFQALRMEVNQERAALEGALPALRDALVPGGRLLVITYHSGEDRIVKHAFREWARSCVCPPRQPVCTCRGRPLGVIDPRRSVRPTPRDVAANPRARSATLRGFRKAHA
jgi:16S rRNA (cytosine1402-N4)-methyltransferase